jgi:O-glycosyl hydrolase
MPKKIIEIITALYTLMLSVHAQPLNIEPFNRHWKVPFPKEVVDQVDLSIEGSNQSLENMQVEGSFAMDKEYGLESIWGRGFESPGKFFNGLLPALFIRSLQLNELNLQDGKLLWILTGPDGGITLTITDNTVKINSKYYDSYGHNEQYNDTIIFGRHPVSVFTESIITYSGNLSTITIEKSHDLTFTVWLNNKQVLKQINQLDLTRHQIRYTGTKGTVSGNMWKASVKTAAITIDESVKHQEIIGFGGICTPTAYYLLSDEGKEKYWQYLQEYNLLIQREYPNGKKLNPEIDNWDSIQDATVHYYGDNFPNGEISDFEYNSIIQDLGGMVIFEFWQLPPWALQKADDTDKKDSPHKWMIKPIYEKYVEAIVEYCRTSQNRTSQPPAIVGIQNEITQKHVTWQQMAVELRKGLDEAGYQDVKIHMHNPPFLEKGLNALKGFSGNEQSWECIDYLACNMYDYQKYFRNPDAYDTIIAKWNSIAADVVNEKPFLSTEISVNYSDYQSGSYAVALLMGELYHKNMTLMNASSLMYCWTLLNNVQQSYTASRSLFTIDETHNFMPAPSSYQLRVFGAYSRKLLPGYKRIDASSENKDLLVSAYEKDRHIVLIMINRSTDPLKINLDKYNFNKMELTNQYYQNQEMTINNELIIKGGDVITLF